MTMALSRQGQNNGPEIISIMSMRTTEVKVTREVVTSQISASESAGSGQDKDLEGGCGGGGAGGGGKRGYKPYTVTIDATGERAPLSQMASNPGRGALGRVREPDDVAWSYTRAALSYFVAMVVTWVSSHQLFPFPSFHSPSPPEP